MIASLALVPLAYLVGTFPTAQLVGRSGGRDVLREGSGNPGASNVYRLMGRGPAALVFAGDVLKGALPAAVGLLLWGHAGGYALGAAAVVGHVFPVSRRFRGGRGVATAGGLALALYPLVSLGLIVVFFLVSALTHRASLASLVIAVALPVAVWATGEAVAEVALLGGVSALVVLRHLPNLRRLLRGQELRVGRSRSTGPTSGGADGESSPERGAA